MPFFSNYFEKTQLSATRIAASFLKNRQTPVDTVIDVSVGNVPLPMHPVMINRMHDLANPQSPFARGQVQYTPSGGTVECRDTFLKVLASSGFDTGGVQALVTGGSSDAAGVLMSGICGEDRPLLVLDPTYTCYTAYGKKMGRRLVSVPRELKNDGHFSFPSLKSIESVIQKENPSAVLVIPYDNPTGQLFPQSVLDDICRLCVKYDLWALSDEAYRELYYTDEAKPVSIWGTTELEVPGITGRRISLDTTSKVWNACGLRIGAILTDNPDLYDKSLACASITLCPGAIDQYIFAAVGNLSLNEMRDWYNKQRAYYKSVSDELHAAFKNDFSDALLSTTDAAIYSVVDLKNAVPKDFDVMDFIRFCAGTGSVRVKNKTYTLLTAPLTGFYTDPKDGRTQLRIAYVQDISLMKLIPTVLRELLASYLKASF